MCGIVGYVGNQAAWPIILEGLQRLEYRGYDSAGIAVLGTDGELRLRKTVGKVDGLTRISQVGFPEGTVGLGHTRWATHGPPTDANAHPLTECGRQVAVVHNGIVETPAFETRSPLARSRFLLGDGYRGHCAFD